MVLFTVTTDEALRSQVYEEMLCPTTGQVEPMKLQLYERRVQHLLYDKIEKQPIAKFFRLADESEIDEAHWTNEMRTACKGAIKQATPTPRHYKKLSPIGKGLAMLVAILALVLAGFLGWYLLIERPNRLKFEQEISRMPEVGDMYYVEVNDLAYKGSSTFAGYAWAKVLEVYPPDSTVKLQLSTDLVPQTEYRPASKAEHSTFAGYIYTTKFIPQDEGTHIDFHVIGHQATIGLKAEYGGEVLKLAISPEEK